MGELGLGLGSRVQFGLGARARQSFCLMNYGRSSITRFLCSARSPPRFVCCLPVWRSFIVGQTASLQPRRNVGGKVSKVHVAQVARSVVAREATDSSKDSFEDSFEDGDKDSDKGQDEDERTGEHEILIAPPSGSAAGQSSGQPSLGATHDKLGAIGSRMHR